MNLEIERKFLVINNDYKSVSQTKVYIKQGFLNSNKERVVRIRITDHSACLTIKGISKNNGTSRFEWEKEIDLKEAEELIKLCEPGIIEKFRFIHKTGDHTYEIDEFLGDNEGLIIAELELTDVDEIFNKPDYLGEEVTGEERYFNSNLSKCPFNSWQ